MTNASLDENECQGNSEEAPGSSPTGNPGILIIGVGDIEIPSTPGNNGSVPIIGASDVENSNTVITNDDMINAPATLQLDEVN